MVSLLSAPPWECDRGCTSIECGGQWVRSRSCQNKLYLFNICWNKEYDNSTKIEKEHNKTRQEIRACSRARLSFL